MSDHDLERLEASLRQLQRQESATRLRASNLAPVPGLAPVHASGRRHSGERFGDGFRSPRSLESARLPPPPAMSRRNIGTPAMATHFLAVLWGGLLIQLLLRVRDAPTPDEIESRARAAAQAVLTLYPPPRADD